MILRTNQCHALSVHSNDAPGLFAQEYHHVYWGAMFLLFHQAEKTQRKVSRYGNVQFYAVTKSSQHDSRPTHFRFKQAVKEKKLDSNGTGTSSKHGIAES